MLWGERKEKRASDRKTSSIERKAWARQNDLISQSGRSALIGIASDGLSAHEKNSPASARRDSAMARLPHQGNRNDYGKEASHTSHTNRWYHSE